MIYIITGILSQSPVAVITATCVHMAIIIPVITYCCYLKLKYLYRTYKGTSVEISCTIVNNHAIVDSTGDNKSVSIISDDQSSNRSSLRSIQYNNTLSVPGSVGGSNKTLNAPGELPIVPYKETPL